ncbi:putative RNA methyltransferase pc1998 [Porphyridium purpureum]|uniref:Putative RNA methyltransferase pc1998 n=1 Tax=Porphyridium purpureum TaxID=35688 RepID=A0A5J4YN80_PORPP|nr:putative RNA methyltransferase pc1998 [Porphyridium purpureum]|eukprot:POR2065..scf222_8
MMAMEMFVSVVTHRQGQLRHACDTARICSSPRPARVDYCCNRHDDVMTGRRSHLVVRSVDARVGADVKTRNTIREVVEWKGENGGDGARAVLRLKAVENAGEDSDKYVVCPGCAVAYFVGRAQVLSSQVQCANCAVSFVCGATHLFELAPTETAPRQPHEIACEHFGACSGCTLNERVNMPPLAEELQSYAKDALRYTSPVLIHCGEERGWRTQAKLAVRGSPNPVMGLFKQGTHQVVPIPNCQVHHPSINVAAEIVNALVSQLGITAYNEISLRGQLRYVQYQVERASGEVVVSFVWNADQFLDVAKFGSRLANMLWNQRNEAKVKAIWFHLNDLPGNAILAPNPRKWKCIKSVKLDNPLAGMTLETIFNVPVYFTPYSFRQANLDAFEAMLVRMAKFVPKRSKVVEFCAGVGVIGLSLLQSRDLSSLLCTEINRMAEDGFYASLAKLPRDLQSRAQFKAAPMNAVLHLLDGCDVLVIDPPRSGFDKTLMDHMIGISSSNGASNARSRRRSDKGLRLIYISCGFKAFQRDALQLCRVGWKLRHVDGSVFFPGSNHIETLAVFDAPSPDDNLSRAGVAR